LMKPARPVAVSILRALALELFQKPRSEPLVDQVSGVIPPSLNIDRWNPGIGA
jgi:hypothetical protein